MTSTQTPLTEPVPGSSASPPTYAEVVFNMPVREAFTYEIPSPLQGSVQVGMRVFVPFGRRKLTGYVVALTPHRNTEAPLKSIEDLPDTEPVVPEEILNLTRWVADYYQASWGQALKAALPAGLDDPGRNVLTLSEEGLSALDHESLSEPAFRILETVRERRRVTGPQLQRRLKKQFSAYALARLKQDGLLLEETHIQRSTVNYRYEKFVRPVGETESPETLEPRLRRSPKQKAVYEFLGSAGKTATELNRAFPGCSGILKKLQDKGLVEIQVVKNHREDPGFPSAAPGGPEAPRTFTADQETVYRELVASLDRKEFRTFLLHGVTGSGKTEIYLQCIQKMLDQGRSAIMMVPEISLTPQTVSRFQNRFGNRLAVLHSGLSPTERYQEWKKIFDGRVSIVVGARSAVFAPVRNLGVIVIDEEHDGSYKQETTPRYHARDTAIVRARTRNATVLLGSATPSLESLGNALSGKYQYLSLHRRIQDRLLPVVHITDMKQEKEENRNFSILSHALKRATRARLDQGEQVFLFLNRRGTANYVFCRDCGFVFHCPRCSVTLTFHGKEQRMRCHYCNHQARTPDSCVDCRGAVIRYSGFGTQKLEDETRRLFPDARIVRLDRDTTRDRSAFDLMHERMSRGDIDILIGTQMIT
ncbi:MAG: primosomal protein N', partial [Nitrospinaceae bacterium]|nr:primosomal protein N' [Nitrospinaceae bacterium]NIR57560.1 primosomal protein N' [Nitrospinaceae bacterium]NIS88030.1 primosomal protein N' [Nitrospinaceae bacterium]NIT84894.1 primosomal protein N' [Nitrospinaceae bacterium]NIU47070.1 primosomal protein N' [Nitrospinaceae bacterium]